MTLKIGLVCSLLLFGLVACQSISAPTSEPTSLPVVGVNDLQFTDAETGRRFRTLDQCIKRLVDDSWRATAYHLAGNFYTARWCRGAGARLDCEIAGSTQDERDQRVIELYTLFYPKEYPQVFGLGFHSLWVPPVTGWGASFDFAEQGASVVGEGWQVSFREYLTPTGEAAATVSLGQGIGYRMSGPQPAMVELASDLPERADLALYLAGPEAMRDRALLQKQALADKVTTAITTHQITTCDQGPYLGKGLPPDCPPRPLTSDEEAAELAHAHAYFAEQAQLLRDHYQAMYAAWLAAFPLDQCWP